MNVQTIVEFVVKWLFLGFGDKLKGVKTIIIAVATVVLGAWEWLTGSGLFSKLCDWFNFACDIESSKFFGIVLVIIGIINAILRAVTDSPMVGMAKRVKMHDEKKAA